MSFHRKRLVKKPRKIRNCELCAEKIEGEHYYHSAMADGQFQVMRTHVDCWNKIEKVCIECDYINDCQHSMQECYEEKVKHAEAMV